MHPFANPGAPETGILHHTQDYHYRFYWWSGFVGDGVFILFFGLVNLTQTEVTWVGGSFKNCFHQVVSVGHYLIND